MKYIPQRYNIIKVFLAVKNTLKANVSYRIVLILRISIKKYFYTNKMGLSEKTETDPN